ncbi:MAG: NAD-dependent epimerase/dehydratase family protein [Gammaproteobacteria bacterium]|nr:NAD-dependent epimerase/dehydratase family protein [Gammaproteobacteria bacterium]
MKVAVFGGSGFLGYDFVRLALKEGGVTPVVYSSSAKSLSNVARHEVDIRLYPSAEPASVTLDEDVDLLINFSHPFERRDGISGYTQVQRFADFVGAARRHNPRLRLIHTSSMSVYEPFAPGHEFDERASLRAPRHDRYAREKICAEQALLALPDAASWQLHLRPTVVYGPFCGVWTDRIFEAFMAGDVDYRDLSGRIQPLYGEDLSRLLLGAVRNFRPGIYNVPGPETLRWQEFMGAFAALVGHGRLRHRAEGGGAQTWIGFYTSNLRELLHAVRREPAFNRIALRIARHLPERSVLAIRDLLLGRGERAPRNVEARGSDEYMRAFFAEDRLVSAAQVMRDFPDFKPRALSACADDLGRYYRYRYSDDQFVEEPAHG